MNHEMDMNCELDLISQQLLLQLNDIISCLQTQEATLENDIKNFQRLYDTFYDLRYAKRSNKSSSNPSVKINKELKAIHRYLMLNITLMRNQHKKRLAYLHSEQMKEEKAYPQIETSEKLKLKHYFSRTVLFIQRMELLLE